MDDIIINVITTPTTRSHANTIKVLTTHITIYCMQWMDITGFFLRALAPEWVNEKYDPFHPPHLTSPSWLLKYSNNLRVATLVGATPSTYQLYIVLFWWANPRHPSVYPSASSHACAMKHVQMKHNLPEWKIEFNHE
jgi:hypothetical protein